MARQADTQATTDVLARELHKGDLIRTHTGDNLLVTEVGTRGQYTRVEARWRDQGGVYLVDADRKVTVFTEHACDCGGTGIYHGAGYVENGVFKGTTGPHFACHGKGWQSRADVIRNWVYWAKYARISA